MNSIEKKNILKDILKIKIINKSIILIKKIINTNLDFTNV